ncbi:MAG: hypothetical protein IJA72_02600 [Clostridia bacterium]|nr:hypothetical protein [Clostridia bacterium]
MNKLIKTYLGFSIKSRAIVIGQDRLKATKDKVYLIVYCSTASQNLKDLTFRLAEKYKCKAICLDDTLENYTSLEGCKVMGLTNMSLANAILKVAENKQEGEINGK